MRNKRKNMRIVLDGDHHKRLVFMANKESRKFSDQIHWLIDQYLENVLHIDPKNLKPITDGAEIAC